MEELPKNLISFFASFFISKSPSKSESDKLIRRMLSTKEVQEIIINAMYKLEPIINTTIIHIRNPEPPKETENPLRKSRLLSLSNDIKYQIQNFLAMQEKLSSVLSIVNSIDLNVEYQQAADTAKSETHGELVSFLQKISDKKPISNVSIEYISDDTWTKHLEVEKMLEIELEKYYINLNSLDSKYFQKTCLIKLRAGKKIEKLENELEKTWNFFRLLVDRASMAFEDKLSFENETAFQDKLILSQRLDIQPKDYDSAIAKIKSLVAIRNILEKKKTEYEKLTKGLNTKIECLDEKVVRLIKNNLELIENCSSLSWCLEFIFNKSDIPDSVRSKVLKLLHKQKCAKLQGLFQIDNILEKYSVETVSQRFKKLREGLNSLSTSIKDENLRIKLTRLVNESKLDDIDKTELLKNIQHAPGLAKQKSPKKEEAKEKPVKESALDKMKKAMKNIDKELEIADKAVEDIIVQSSANIESLRRKSKLVTFNARRQVSPNSVKSVLKTEVPSYFSEDMLKEEKSTQTEIEYSNKESQKSLDYLTEVIRFLTQKRKVKNDSDEELGNFIITACKEKAKERTDNCIQTDKELGIFEFSLPNNTVIRGIMNKIRKKNSEKMSLKEPLDPNVADNLVIKKIGKAGETFLTTEIDENFSNGLEPQIPDNGFELSQKTPAIKRATLLPETLNQITKNKTDEKSSSLSKLNRLLPKTEMASEDYKKEFALQAQIQGKKNLNFEDIQKIWEDVINRRIVDGEKDKVSIYLRGYLGTDKYEEEKAKIIKMILSETGINGKPKLKISNLRAVENWKKIMRNLFQKLSLSFKSQLDSRDSPREVMFKLAKNLRYVKHRLPFNINRSLSQNKKPEVVISYSSEKWSLHSTSVSPVLSTKNISRKKINRYKGYLNMSSKSPIRDKYKNSRSNKLPFIALK